MNGPAVLGAAVAGAIALSSLAAGAQTPPQSTTPRAGAPLALPALRLTLSGNPATPAFIVDRISAAVLARAPAGATYRLQAILPMPQILDRGFLTSFHVALTVDPGNGAPASSAAVDVDVVNTGVPAFAPARLAFADDPERITAAGVLSRTTVDVRTPARLYYYHENRSERRRFCVVLAANGSVRTRLHIVGATAGPNIDVMSVGHAVSKTFVARAPHNEGEVVEIAGGLPILQRDTIVNPGDGVVGALDLRVLSGGPVTVTVLAIPPAAEPAQYLYAPKLPDDGHARHGTFDLSDFGQRVIAYTHGGPDVVDEYGSRARTPANLDPADPGHDYGDYGVLRRLTFDVANPSAVPATVYLFEKPLGGVVRSSFAVNGALVDVGCVRVPQRYEVARYQLAPHATAALDVLTMTDGGSNYPLQIGLTATPPLPQAPPIGAPDGCFPKASAPAAQPLIRPAGR